MLVIGFISTSEEEVNVSSLENNGYSIKSGVNAVA